MMKNRKELLFATNNQHKKEEIQQILHNYSITSISDYGCFEEIEENGDSFAENAKIKAKFCFEAVGKLSIGDDSGLVIPALGGKPGICSARYAGDHDFDANIRKVIEEMKDVIHREAYFVTVLCLFCDEREEYFEGRVYGEIACKPSGIRGFGYDSIFIPKGYGISFAEMSTEQKNKISHRAEALKKLLSYLGDGK